MTTEQLLAEAKDSLLYALKVDAAVIIPCCLKWIDVVDDLWQKEDDRLRKDLEALIVEPLRLLHSACLARTKQLGLSLTSASPDGTDVLTKKRAYLKAIETLLEGIKAIGRVS